MKFIVENWFVIVAIAAVGGSIGYAIYSFAKMPSDKQLNKVREWLLYAVTKAEKELGAGTGKLKLRYVYDMFVARFEWLAKVITFDMFSMMVDEALEQMRTMLDSNEAVQKLIANEAGEGSEWNWGLGGAGRERDGDGVHHRGSSYIRFDVCYFLDA